MLKPKSFRKFSRIIFLLFFILQLAFHTNAQINRDSVNVKSLYRPPVSENRDTTPVSDSGLIREKFIYDSIQARLAFIRDSIAAREQFIRDSIARRQRILDSLNILKAQLPGLLEAAIKTLKDDIILENNNIAIIGDSMLGNYTWRILPLSLSQPYKPWIAELNLSNNSVKFGFIPNTSKINSIQGPGLNANFVFGKQNNILRINERAIILNKSTGNYYKEPFDSVFYDTRGRIAKIKRYIYFHQATSNYQKGAPLFIHLAQVKQYEYDFSNQLSKCEEVNFCDRWGANDPGKVCNIIIYTFNFQDKTYSITRKNDPPNNYSDGTFTLEFDANDNLKSLAFKNVGNSENWITHVEVNKDGNALRYLYEIKGKIHQSLDFIYHLDDPYAKYKIEMIKNIFEDDGICYQQNNTTTGKTRIRDRMTGEWGPWR